MIGTRLTWLGFGLCLLVAAAAMGWLTVTVVRLDRAEAEASRQALLEENVRLALWRMDSAMGPLIAAESARPYFAYAAFYAPQRAYTRMFAPMGADEVLLPSELLTARSPQVHLHFQVEPDSRLTSPQILPGALTASLGPLVVAPQTDAEAMRSRLDELARRVGAGGLAGWLPETTQEVSDAPEAEPSAEARAAPESPGAEMLPGRAGAFRRQQNERNIVEQQARYNQAIENRVQTITPMVPAAEARRNSVHEGPMQPVWVEDALILARRVRVDGQEYVQGCWLDWSAIRGGLLAAVADLLPEADLRAAGAKPQAAGAVEGARPRAASSAASNGARMLASLPVELVPGAVPVDPIGGRSPLRLSLLFAWASTLLAVAAVAVLLVGALSLSERRAAFVSAVTHELRTPLTTFKLYTEMLAEGMVPDEGRRRYLDTLRTEAGRLSHLVENVLAYARLEGRRASAPAETVTVADLVGRTRDRLAARAELAGMTLTVEMDSAAWAAQLKVNTSAVEQILLNLVDNACKYAAGASDRHIHLSGERIGDRLVLRVRDHGPGIAGQDARRVFRPFFKSAREAAHTAPGVGLGLALSRRLARSMKGSLALDPSAHEGACFSLTLPCD